MESPQGESPPDDLMGSVAGYTATDNLIAPPAQDVPQATPSAPPAPPKLPTHVTEDQARAALQQLVGQNICWGKKAAEEMDLTSITSTSAFHYKLETFTESRKTAWAYTPYQFESVDGPFNGPAPLPWNIPIYPDAFFQAHEKICEVPHTANVKPCRFCSGIGSKRCLHCDAKGIVRCNSCHGNGYVNGPNGRDRCMPCDGHGNKKCASCQGKGSIRCGPCGAKGQLKWFIKLTVTWQTHVSDHIIERTALPDNLIRGAAGQLAYEDMQIMVAPVSHFPINEINDVSLSLVREHATGFPNKRILKQRHQVRVVPVSEVQGEYKGRLSTFWVYGTNTLAYAPDYPQKCCCGCSIL